MGIIHIIKNIDASNNNVGYTPLIPNGLQYLNFFGGDAPVGRNLAPGKPHGVVVGSPTVGSMSQGVTFTNVTNYVQTDVPHTEEMTLMAVVKASGDGEYFAISNFESGVVGATLRLRTSTSNQGKVSANMISAYTADGVVTAQAAFTTSVPWPGTYTIAGRINFAPGAASGIRVNNLTAGLVGDGGAIPSNATLSIGNKLRIGSGYSNYAGTLPVPVLFAAIWDRYLSDAELDAQYAQLKEFYQTVKAVAV